MILIKDPCLLVFRTGKYRVGLKYSADNEAGYEQCYISGPQALLIGMFLKSGDCVDTEDCDGITSISMFNVSFTKYDNDVCFSAKRGDMDLVFIISGKLRSLLHTLKEGEPLDLFGDIYPDGRLIIKRIEKK